MDPKSSNKYLQPCHSYAGHGVGVRKGNPPMAANKRSNGVMVDAPATPGRPVFSFTTPVGNNSNGSSVRNKVVPSKWNDAEKWVIHRSPNHHHLDGFVKSADFVSRKSSTMADQKVEIFQDSSSSSSDVLKDRFTNELEADFLKVECLEPLSESFLFRESTKNRDIGTDMTPPGSSTISRCLTPPRHNTPHDPKRSDPSETGHLDCHLAAKLTTPFLSNSNLNSNWRSREEEEEDISKSLKHFEMTETRASSASVWEQEDTTKCCLRYQREEANIKAWVDLQNAKAEAESRKLEVKIQKMRSKFEEKVMRKMAIVYRKAEELRAAARVEHTEQIQKTTEQAKKTINQHINMHFGGRCGCFPCNNNTNNLHP